MLGNFINRGLVLVLGYAYPAFECFKTVEKNRVEIEELRFWCQYWIIVAVSSVFEGIADIFISWVPFYGEMKVGLFVYLWYPKTKGTGYVYETFLRPYAAKYQPDIDRKLQELRARAWDLAIYYWQNGSKQGQATFLHMIQSLASQSGKVTQSKKEVKSEARYPPTSAAPPPSPSGSPSFHRLATKHRQLSKQSSDRRRPPLPPTPPGSASRSVAQSPKSDAVQVHLHSQAEFIHTLTQEEPEPAGSTSGGSSSAEESETGAENKLQDSRLRLRRSKGIQHENL